MDRQCRRNCLGQCHFPAENSPLLPQTSLTAGYACAKTNICVPDNASPIQAAMQTLLLGGMTTGALLGVDFLLPVAEGSEAIDAFASTLAGPG